MTRSRVFLPVIFSLSVFLLTSCVRAASSAPAPTLSPDFPAPLDTPLGSAPKQSCRPADLKTSSNFGVTNGTVVIGITLVNASGYACQLAGAPQVAFLAANGSPIPIQTQPADLGLVSPMPATLSITPGESAIISLAWSNACALPADEKIIIQITFASGETLQVRPENLSFPRCDDKSRPSIVIIAPYSYPP
jgi:hypothetical protein